MMGVLVAVVASMSPKPLSTTAAYTAPAAQVSTTAPMTVLPSVPTHRAAHVGTRTQVLDSVSARLPTRAPPSSSDLTPVAGPSRSPTQLWGLIAMGCGLMSVAAFTKLRLSRPSTHHSLEAQHMVMAASIGAKSWGRREVISSAVGAGLLLSSPRVRAEEGESATALCDASCMADFAKAPVTTTASGLQYRDLVVGDGLQAVQGQGVTFHLVAQMPSGRIFINTLEKGIPLDARLGTESIAPVGLDEGLSTMKVGGIRRIYCPGELAYTLIPTVGIYGTKSKPSKPPAPPGEPVIFDVQLLLLPGVEAEEEEGEFDFAF